MVATLACLLSIGCGCWANEETARIWQEKYREGLFPGYQNFRVITCDGDIGWSLFSYELPANAKAADVIPVLRSQITGIDAVLRPGMALQWPFASEDATNLHVRSTGEDDWRIRVSPARRRVTAMYASLDSEAERDAYPRLVAAFERAYRE